MEMVSSYWEVMGCIRKSPNKLFPDMKFRLKFSKAGDLRIVNLSTLFPKSFKKIIKFA